MAAARRAAAGARISGEIRLDGSGERVDIGGALSANLFDLVFILFLFGMFVLGFIQGTIRRVLGLASILFAFLLAGQLRQPLGAFLADNWTQFRPSAANDALLGWCSCSPILSVIIQSFTAALLSSRACHEILGGIIGSSGRSVGIGIVILTRTSSSRVPRSTLELLRPAIFDLYDHGDGALPRRAHPGRFRPARAARPRRDQGLLPRLLDRLSGRSTVA
jgi:hypothetical protein